MNSPDDDGAVESMGKRRRKRGGFDIAEFLGTDTSSGRFNFWACGVVCAVVVALYGLTCMATQTAVFVGRRPIRIVSYSGGAAVAFGVFYLSAALFLHCHFCWSENEKYHGYAAIGKIAALVGIVGGLLFAVLSALDFS